MTTRNGLSRTFHALSNPPSIHHPLPYLTLLSSCKSLKTLLQIHAHLILSGGLPHDNFTSTHLIDTYSSFQKPETARIVFDSTPTPRAILYNTMIRAYTRSNQHTQAIELYHGMLDKEIKPDKYTYTSVLKACTGVGDSKLGFLVHHDIVSKGLENDVFIGTGLVDMYSKIGDFGRAREVFDKMPVKDIVVWNAMIAGLSQSEEPREGLSFFRVMQSVARLEPTSVSLLNVFPAICKLLDVKSCKAIHGYVCKRCFPSAVSNGLIDTYSKCGNVDVARKVFDRMWGLDDVSWGTMMAGYVHNGRFCEVLDLFDCMKRENPKMNKVSAVSALLAAAEMRDLDRGMEIHECAIQQRIDSNVLVATPLMTMYAKCGELEKAKNLFRGLQGRDLVAWSAVIAAFVQSGYHIEALSLFREMQNENIKANRVTLVSVLPACAELLFVKLGKSLHCYALKTDTDSDVSTGTALVSMYAKCDCFNLARTLFNKMRLKDVVTWNALINGYAQIGDPYNAMEIFYQLQSLGVQPDSVIAGDLDGGIFTIRTAWEHPEL
ncbi:hypothetical protein RJ639_033692 [Escallonia herrerae]|uniref:Pentatricopeptide repeat-containing protein n=1 Tax=Escallonia herrerae TaxID=1293975 RepID=A0AA88WUQ4_9ASTE|nr:hypothetical protein RJ639_033692 [Escallonia herrerae]